MDDSSDSDEIKRRLVDLENSNRLLEASLIRQEHRLIPVLQNLLKFAWPEKDDAEQKVLREAAFSAFFHWFVFSRKITVGAGVCTAVVGLYLAYTANQLLQSQNELIEKQNFLVESSRRSTLVFELSSILDEIDEELDERKLLGESQTSIEEDPETAEWTSMLSASTNLPSECDCITLSERLNGRIVAASQVMLPYKYQTDSGELSDLASPEQGQLFVSLVRSGVCIPDGTNLDYAVLQGVDVSDSRLCYADLSAANLTGAFLSSSSLVGATLSHARLQDAKLASVIAIRSIVGNGTMRDANLNFADFSFSWIMDVDMENTNLDRASFIGANVSGARLVGANLNEANFTYASFESSTLSGSDLSKADFTWALFRRKVDMNGVKNWREIKSMRGTNIFGILNAPVGFEEWALESGAVKMEDVNKWNELRRVAIPLKEIEEHVEGVP